VAGGSKDRKSIPRRIIAEPTGGAKMSSMGPLKRLLLGSLLALSVPAAAGDRTLDAAVGGAVGGAIGGAVGETVGGRDGAIIGAGVGAAAGAAANTEEDDGGHGGDGHRHGERHDHHQGGYFCPPGQAKKGNC
jgi:hypothetical protein